MTTARTAAGSRAASLTACLALAAAVMLAAGCAAPSHRFLACGGETRIVEPDGRSSWTYPHATRDGQVLPDGHVLLALSKSAEHPHGAVVELDPAAPARPVFAWEGTQSEVNTAQRLPDGTTMVSEAGDAPRILVLDRGGTVLRQVPLRCQTANHHMESRMARMLPGGNVLVPQLLDRVVREYAPDGAVVREFRTPDEPKDAWPFTAIRLPDGHTLVTCTHANMVVEFDGSGAIAWTLSNADFDRPLLNDPCGAQRLPNGNTVVCSYAIGAGGTKLVEVDRAKRLVWTFAEPAGPGIHEVHVLESGGVPVPPPPMR